MSRQPMTAKGVERLRAELQVLRTKQRPEIIRAIAEARAHGDLRENAEYHAAKEQQGFIEGKISELEHKLSRAEIIDPSKLDSGGRVVFGATVELCNVETSEGSTYQIVGELEADIGAGLISISSPTARALIGKQSGDEVTVAAPAGLLRYEIVEVYFD